MDMNEIKEIFFQECEEQLAELETGLLAINDGDSDPETVNAVFRAVHSIKGGAGAFALDELVGFAHVFETTLDGVRSNELEPTKDVVKVLLKSSDVLADLTNAARDGGSVDAARCEALVVDLKALANGGAAPSADDAEAADEAPEVPSLDEESEFAPVPIVLEEDSDNDGFMPVAFSFDDFDDEGSTESDDGEAFRISLHPKPDLYLKGNETLLLLRELGTLGAMTVTCDQDQLPNIDKIDPEGSYLTWVVDLTTSQDEEAIRSVFEFAEWDCDIEITAMTDDGAVPDELVAEIEVEDITEVASPADTPETPAEQATTTAETVVPAASPVQPAEPAASPNVIDLKKAAADKAAPDPKQPTASKSGPKQANAGAQSTIRVELDRVDKLINLVGELVINQAMLAQSVQETVGEGSSAVTMGLEELQQLTREIQDSVMAIRAQPVKPIFQRM